MKNLYTCSSGDPNERHCTSKLIAPASTAASTGGSSEFDSKRLKSRRTSIFFLVVPFPLHQEDDHSQYTNNDQQHN